MGLILLILFSSSAASFSLGISPSVSVFENVLRGGYAERSFVVSTSSPEPLEIGITIGGQVADWISVDERAFVLDPSSRKAVTVRVEPPEDVPNGVYPGYIIASAKPTVDATDVLGSVIITAVEMQIKVQVTGDQIIKFAVPVASVKDTEEGQPIEFVVGIDNAGNTRMTPGIHIDIEDRTNSVVKSFDYSQTEIKPTTYEEIFIKIPNDLEIGKYTAKISAKVGDEVVQKSLEFEVLERGSLRLKGELVTIRTDKVWAEVGDVVELTAVFKNTGQLVAPAVFKGKIYLGDNLVDVLEGDEIDVPVGETVELKSFYNPEQPGRYKVVGWVYYSKKVTKERFVILNIQQTEEVIEEQPVEEEAPSNTLYLVIVVLLLVIVLLAALMLKDRNVKGRR